MALLTWQEGETEKFLGTHTIVKDAAGIEKKKRDTQTVKFSYPVINPLEVHEDQDLFKALAEIIASGKVGFQSRRMVVEHLNYGMLKDLARQFNQGQDIRYSASQQEAIKLYRSLMTKGHIPHEDAVRLLQMQGVSDAEQALAMPEPEPEPAS